jgi:hypothetical protein
MYFLGSPNVFKIKFTKGESTLDDPLNIKDLDSIGRFKTCALVSFNVNYTPDGFYAAYSDAEAGGSQPVSVTMQMGFSELTPVFSDEFDLNDNKVNLGPSKFTNDYDSRVQSVPNEPNEPTDEEETAQAVRQIRQQAIIQAGSTTDPSVPNAGF